MTHSMFAGRWKLIAASETRSEVAFTGDAPDPNAVGDWLNGSSVSSAAISTPASGLTLEIEPGGHFNELASGKVPVQWFDVEGVLVGDVAPFAGELVIDGNVAYLRPDDIPKWGIPAAGRYGGAILRLDDGDTKICDKLERREGRLVRTVNVVTDELYLNRITLLYEKS